MIYIEYNELFLLCMEFCTHYIGSVFSKQKSGICAIMTRFASFKYRVSVVPMYKKCSYDIFELLILMK